MELLRRRSFRYMGRTPVLLALVGTAATALLAGCASDEEPVAPEVPLAVSTVRDCLRAAGSFPEDVPAVVTGAPKLNGLVRRAKHGRGAVRTPPPDPTHTGYVTAYFFLFDDPAGARRAAAVGREVVLEFRNRFRSSVSSETDYDTADVQKNVLALYLEDPANAEGQKEDIDQCIRDAPR